MGTKLEEVDSQFFDMISNIFFMLVKIFTTLFDPSSRHVKSVKWTSFLLSKLIKTSNRKLRTFHFSRIMIQRFYLQTSCSIFPKKRAREREREKGKKERKKRERKKGREGGKTRRAAAREEFHRRNLHLDPLQGVRHRYQRATPATTKRASLYLKCIK